MLNNIGCNADCEIYSLRRAIDKHKLTYAIPTGISTSASNKRWMFILGRRLIETRRLLEVLRYSCIEYVPQSGIGLRTDADGSNKRRSPAATQTCQSIKQSKHICKAP